jgi:hypothetical protein
VSIDYTRRKELGNVVIETSPSSPGCDAATLKQAYDVEQ